MSTVTKQMENILSLIPQRPPFVMVDKLLYCDDMKTQTTFRINEGNVLITNGKFTEAGLMENIAQTAAARAGYMAMLENEPVSVGYVGAVKHFGIFDLPQVNDNLLTEIIVGNQVFDVTIIAGTIKCGDRLIAKCEMNIFITR